MSNMQPSGDNRIKCEEVLTPPTHPQSPPQSPSQSQDYNSLENWTRSYLNTYYTCAPTIDEIAINKFIVEELRRLDQKFDNYVEISGEGGVHHMISFTPYVKAFHSTDFRDDARAESEKWRRGDKDAFNWNHYVEMALKHEGAEPSPDAIASRVSEMRTKIAAVEPCNVLESPIVDTSKVPLTPNTVTGMFFVSGEVGETIDGWKKVMKNFADSIAPGGHVIITALRGMKEYKVHQPDGSEATHPCAELYGHHFKEILPSLGFNDPEVKELEIANPDIGVNGVIMVSATKAGG